MCTRAKSIMYAYNPPSQSADVTYLDQLLPIVLGVRGEGQTRNRIIFRARSSKHVPANQGTGEDVPF